MALPVFDPLLHHVGLGPTGSLKGFLVQGALSENFQPVSGGSEFGSERDLIAAVPSLSRWTQDDFSGGAFQHEWGADPAMFSYSLGFLPKQLGRSARTVPPFELLGDAGGGIYTKHLGTAGAYIVQVWDNQTTSFITRYLESPFSFTDIQTAARIYAACYDPDSARFWSIHSGSPQTLKRTTMASFAFTAAGNCPSGVGNARGMDMRGRDIVVQFGPILYYGVPNDALTSVTWRKVGRLPGAWKDSVTFNSQLYILISDNESTTHVMAFDGTNILPVVELPFNFVGQSITAYAGRLYVGGFGYDFDRAATHGELYEITGSSLRLVRSFSSELGRPVHTINDLMVYDGLLYCAGGHLNFGSLLTYDATTDSLWGGPESAVWSEWLAASRVGGFYMVAGDKLKRITHDDVNLPVGGHDCILETSDFAPEFDLQKRWSKLRVRTRSGGDLAVSYSLNGGTTFTAATVISTTTGDFHDHTIDLTAVAASNQIRFKFTITQASVSTYTELVGFTLQFAFIGGQKRAWLMTVLGVENPEHVDGQVRDYDYASVRTQLQTWHTAGTVLDFTDIHGDTYKATVHEVGVSHPQIGDADAAGDRESLLALTLIEV